ncbi:MAG: hypothetical protein AB8B83_07695 [Bdellovibrionales bacterium]
MPSKTLFDQLYGVLDSIENNEFGGLDEIYGQSAHKIEDSLLPHSKNRRRGVIIFLDYLVRSQFIDVDQAGADFLHERSSDVYLFKPDDVEFDVDYMRVVLERCAELLATVEAPRHNLFLPFNDQSDVVYRARSESDFEWFHCFLNVLYAYQKNIDPYTLFQGEDTVLPEIRVIDRSGVPKRPDNDSFSIIPIDIYSKAIKQLGVQSKFQAFQNSYGAFDGGSTASDLDAWVPDMRPC